MKYYTEKEINNIKNKSFDNGVIYGIIFASILWVFTTSIIGIFF